MFEHAMFLDVFDKLTTETYRRMKEKGFWDEGNVAYNATGEVIGHTSPINIGEKLMLMVSELAEAFEAHRKGQLDAPCDKDCTIIDPKSTEVHQIDCPVCKGSGGTDIVCARCNGAKKINVTGIRRLTNLEEEMADIVIRVADFCGWKGIDLGRAILVKMEYNRSRPHKHGRTC